MTRLPALKPREVMRALERLGFILDHVTGSHYIFRHSDGRRVVVPYHGSRDLKRGVLQSILAQIGLSVEEFLALL